MNEAIDLLVQQIELVWTGTLCSGPQMLHDRFTFMKSSPDIGDLILVNNVGPRVLSGDRIGWLERIEDVLLGPDFDEGATERWWHIDRLDGSGKMRWTNVGIIRVGKKGEDWRDEKLIPIRRNTQDILARSGPG